MSQRDQLFEVRKMIMIYKVQLKTNQVSNKLYLRKMKEMVQKIHIGIDVMEDIQAIKAKIFNVAEEVKNGK